MARIYPLFSSSKGNAAYIGSPDAGILIDAGVSERRLSGAMQRCGLHPQAVQAVFITHDHSDHISGLRVFTKKFGVPVYAQAITGEHLQNGGHISEGSSLHILTGDVSIAGMTVSAFATSHDTAQSCGYRITMPNGVCCAVCTDLGIVTETVRNAVSGCKLVLLEANYDPGMLRSGCYPPPLKARIASDHGHLSNDDSAAFARWLLQTGTTHFVLGHLSQENNTPQLAENTVVSGLAGFIRGQDYLLHVAAPETDGRMIVF